MKNDETGWLIEIADGGPPMWWAASPDPRALGGFDPDSLKATRFAREKDAKDMATFLHVKGAIAFADISNIRITEHAWSDNPTGLGNSAMTLNPMEDQSMVRYANSCDCADCREIRAAVEAARAATFFCQNAGYMCERCGKHKYKHESGDLRCPPQPSGGSEHG